MPITVDSSQWTGERDDTPLPVPVVWGEFETEAARDNAMARLRAAGARDETTPAAAAGGGVAPPVPAANEGQVPAPDEQPRQADARSLRQNAVGIAMAGSGMAAAGLVIATGGAALPAVAAAAAAGLTAGAAGEAVGTAVSPAGQDRAAPVPPQAEGPLIGLQAPDEDARGRGEAALREAGARRVFVQDRRAG